MFYPSFCPGSPGDFLEFGLDCCGMRWDVLFFLASNIWPSGKKTIGSAGSGTEIVCFEPGRKLLRAV